MPFYSENSQAWGPWPKGGLGSTKTTFNFQLHSLTPLSSLSSHLIICFLLDNWESRSLSDPQMMEIDLSFSLDKFSDQRTPRSVLMPIAVDSLC